MTPETLSATTTDLRGGVRLVTGRAYQVTLNPTPKDVIFFVPGTQDPLNLNRLAHQADREYWEHNEAYYRNFLQEVHGLKPQFHDLHIQHEYFSWTGDNNPQSRVNAAARMEELLLRFYPNWTELPVSLHLIGHSHGGNVINEFTKRIAARGSDFPRPWKVKTVVYLSTPFFGRLHQLDHGGLDPDCQVINVRNRYDLTQRVIADYSLRQMPFMMEEIVAENRLYNEGKAQIDGVDTAAFGHMRDLRFSNAEARRVRDALVDMMGGVRKLLNGIHQIVGRLRREFPDFMPQSVASRLRSTLTDLFRWAGRARTRLQNRRGWITRGELVGDLDLAGAAAVLLPLLRYRPATFQSPLLETLAELLLGRIDTFDDTTTTPAPQLGGRFNLTHIEVERHDPYARHRRRDAFERFARGVEGVQSRYARQQSPALMRETLVRLLSQLAPEGMARGLQVAADVLDASLLFLSGAADRNVQALRDSLAGYAVHIERFREGLEVPGYEAEPYPERPGTMGYFAVESHSVSRAELYDEVREALTASFSSGPNPGYQE